MLLSQTETVSARGSGTLIDRDLIERHALAVGLDLDRLEQARARAAGAQAAEFVLQRRVRALHAALEVGEIEFRQLRHCRFH